MSESHGLTGCPNHGCLVQPIRKGGMGTNAICQCLRRDGILAERLVIWLRGELAARDAEIAGLLDEIVRLQEFGKRNREQFAADIAALTARCEELRRLLRDLLPLVEEYGDGELEQQRRVEEALR